MAKRYFLTAVLLATSCSLGVVTLRARAQESNVTIDVQHYVIDAQLVPSEQLLRARTDVVFVPSAETRSAVFELNGSLQVKRISRLSGPAVANTTPAAPAKAAAQKKNQSAGQQSGQSNSSAPAGITGVQAQSQPGQAGELQFIQDNRESMNVRVDLGTVVPKGRPVTLRFEYEGALESAQGGPIQTARLAYVGEQVSYLFYASRWFPFNNYAADRATYDIKVTVPKGFIAVGYSESPVSPLPGPSPDSQTFAFTSKTPVLPGNIAAAKFVTNSTKSGGFTIDVYFKAGNEKWAEHASEIVGKRLEFYSSKFGGYAYGNRVIVAETDEETLPAYSGAGIIFISPRAVTEGFDETLAREVGYQWWGQAVGIKSFDDVWLVQGLAEFSSLLYVRDSQNESRFQQAVRAELERGLAFEQSASIRNAPQQLDDQTPAFRSIIVYKGALVFNMLRRLMGDEKFDAMMRDYYTKYKGRNVNIDEFEQFASQAAGRPLRFFFGQWVDSTGVPEFRAEYRMVRTKEGFRVPGTVKQDLDTFEMPVDILLKTETGNERDTVLMKGTSADFDLTTKSKPVEIVVDPDSKIIRSSDELRQGVIVRRGIEHVREQEFLEAEQQFQAAIKLNRNLSWAWYNLGLLYLTQRNYAKALDAFDQGLNGDLRPDWVEVWSYIYRGNAWDAYGNRERAVAEYNRALSNGNNFNNAQAIAQQYLAAPFDPKRTRQSDSSSQTND
jgi:tetratricopeptide (TPR) repeat protein